MGRGWPWAGSGRTGPWKVLLASLAARTPVFSTSLDTSHRHRAGRATAAYLGVGKSLQPSVLSSPGPDPGRCPLRWGSLGISVLLGCWSELSGRALLSRL